MNNVVHKKLCKKEAKKKMAVVVSKGGQEIIRQRLEFGVIDLDDIFALNKIGTTIGTHFPNIVKPTVVRLLKLMLDIHQMDSQVINGHMARINQLGWQLSNAQQQLAHQEMAAAQQQRVAQKSTVVTQRATGQPQLRVEPPRVGQGTVPMAVSGLIAIEAPRTSEVKEKAQEKCKDVGVGNKSVKRQTCIFFRRGNCKYGPHGHNQVGDCQFEHPLCCPGYELFGQSTRMGCKKSKKCRYLHRDICRSVAKFKKCTDPTGCRFLHPAGLLKIMEQKEQKADGKQGSSTKRSSEAKNQRDTDDLILKIVKILSPRNAYQETTSYSHKKGKI